LSATVSIAPRLHGRFVFDADVAETQRASGRAEFTRRSEWGLACEPAQFCLPSIGSDIGLQ
jgi:hypothetical protein